MIMTRDDCGKETKMESDSALEWIAQQCETTYPMSKTNRRTARWTYMKLWNRHLADDQQGLCEMVVTMDKLNGKAYASELVPHHQGQERHPRL